MATAAEVLQAVRDLDNRMQAGFKDHRAADDIAHDKIISQQDRINGTVRGHSVSMAAMNTTQESVCRRLAKGEEERGTLFKLVREIQKSRAWHSGRMVGVMGVTLLLLQYVAKPLFEKLFGGG